jgi:2-polyprenyl-6-methoxyphenol hydroxylase-like FAD-dependent oxidoreductase
MARIERVQCAIAGGGPAGVMLGYLLARSGIRVAVLEKWPDFFRDFRGDTIHPSTMDVLAELGLLDRFLALPHDETRDIEVDLGGARIPVADFRHVPTRAKFLAFIPQWDFLNFIAAEGKKHPGFNLLMETEATGLIEEGGVVRGLKAKDREGAFEIRAELVIGADGRHSTVRDAAQLPKTDLGAPIDVLWFRLSQKPADTHASLGRVDRGQVLVMIDRTTYWQCAYLIPKGGFDAVKAAGIEAFRARLAALMPLLADRVGEIRSWDDVKMLSVAVDHLDQWYKPGLVCIGDAAHAMSPVGGVGINLAVQDAVAAANILVPAFSRGAPTVADLRAVQKRRAFPALVIQRAQVFIHERVLAPILSSSEPLTRVPIPLRLLIAIPYLRRIPARLVGVGIRPEHVHTRAAEPRA